MNALMAIAEFLRKLPPDVVGLVVNVVAAIADSDNPGEAARRAEEAARRKAFDEAMERIKP
jgi:hypothetical protein